MDVVKQDGLWHCLNCLFHFPLCCKWCISLFPPLTVKLLQQWSYSSCITVWGGSCTEYSRRALQCIVNTASKIIGAPLPSLQTYTPPASPVKPPRLRATPATLHTVCSASCLLEEEIGASVPAPLDSLKASFTKLSGCYTLPLSPATSFRLSGNWTHPRPHYTVYSVFTVYWTLFTLAAIYLFFTLYI